MKTYDGQCYNLACWFLDDIACATDKQRDELARRIQATIEDCLEEYEQDRQDAQQAAYDAYIDAQIDERRLERNAR